MKIYGSTQYVEKSDGKEWYQLDIINQWDWSTKAVAYQNHNNHLFFYCLKKCIAFSSNAYESKIVETLTEEMKDELLNMGYSLK